MESYRVNFNDVARLGQPIEWVTAQSLDLVLLPDGLKQVSVMSLAQSGEPDKVSKHGHDDIARVSVIATETSNMYENARLVELVDIYRKVGLILKQDYLWDDCPARISASRWTNGITARS